MVTAILGVPRYTRIGPTQLSTFTTIYPSTDGSFWPMISRLFKLVNPASGQKTKTWLKMAILPIEWEVNIKQNLPTTHFLFPFPLFSKAYRTSTSFSLWLSNLREIIISTGYFFSWTKDIPTKREDPWNTEVPPRWIDQRHLEAWNLISSWNPFDYCLFGSREKKPWKTTLSLFSKMLSGHYGIQKKPRP